MTIYLAVFACAVPLVEKFSFWVKFLIFLVSIFIAEMIVRLIKKIWKAF
jgi:hypothetical protein